MVNRATAQNLHPERYGGIIRTLLLSPSHAILVTKSL